MNKADIINRLDKKISTKFEEDLNVFYSLKERNDWNEVLINECNKLLGEIEICLIVSVSERSHNYYASKKREFIGLLGNQKGDEVHG